MRMTYDKEADAAYVYIKDPIADGEAKRTVSVSDDVHLDFDGEGHLLGIEILNARGVLTEDALKEAGLIGR